MVVEMTPQANSDLLGNVLNLMQDVTPRDIDALRSLKQHHLILLEVKITAVSAALGLLPERLPLPPRTQIMAVLRHDEALMPGQIGPLQENDVVVLLASIRHESYLRQVLTSPTPIWAGEATDPTLEPA